MVVQRPRGRDRSALLVCHAALCTVAPTALFAAGIALLFAGKSPGFAVLRRLPIWQQVPSNPRDSGHHAVLDPSRLSHPARLRFHAIHHSPKFVDWLSAGRSHFVNSLLSFVLADVAVQLLGFSPAALIVLAPFNVIYSSLVHANLNWTFGPLRFVFASPVFHRWHHTAEGDGIDKNFASTFPLLDLIFGTFYMPAGKLPEQFGNGDTDFPEDFWDSSYIH